jgi:FdrA protein
MRASHNIKLLCPNASASASMNNRPEVTELIQKVIVEKNRYVDSVSLMAVGDQVKRLEGIESAEAQMGTVANREVLTGLGFEISAEVGPNDLILAVSGATEAQLDEALQLIRNILDHKLGADATAISYHSLAEVDLQTDPYDLVQISLPGEYAAAEARQALENGLDVFIFSDNVPLEAELELKKYGSEKGLLVMGPDCGVGLINGVALAAGSIVRPGPIGIVGASGSGAQEVACIIEKCGYGVSTIIGTGGRDLYPQIGGITMLQGIKRLEADQKTDVIVLVSKLADLTVMEQVLNVADAVSKPVVAVFLGSDANLFKGHRVHGVFSLEAAALEAVRLVAGAAPDFGFSKAEIKTIVASELAKYRSDQKYFRGLFCGGTFTEESLIYFYEHNQGIPLYSNLKTRYATRLDSAHVSQGHTILDLGAEEFTAAAPHPVFDPGLRIKRFEQEIQDPEVAVIMLDFITGPGVHEDPVTAFAKVCQKSIKQGQGITFIAAICGSYEDPQNIIAKERLLMDAGVIVTKSNYQSAKLANGLLAALEQRGKS